MGCQNSKKLRAVDSSQSRDEHGSEPAESPPVSGQPTPASAGQGNVGGGHSASSGNNGSNAGGKGQASAGGSGGKAPGQTPSSHQMSSNANGSVLASVLAEDSARQELAKAPASENGRVANERMANGAGHGGSAWAARQSDRVQEDAGKGDAKLAAEGRAANGPDRSPSGGSASQLEPLGRSSSHAAAADAATKGNGRSAAKDASGSADARVNGGDDDRPRVEDRAPGSAFASLDSEGAYRPSVRKSLVQTTPDGTPGRTPTRSRNVSVSRHNTTGHMTFKVATATHIGFGPLKRENQDEVYVEKCLQGHESASVFCVFDGHGARGKDVSTFVRDRLPYILSQAMDGTKTHEEIHAALTESFLRTNAELREGPIDCSMSGTTCCVAYVRGQELHVASCGDSRAVLVSEVARDELPGDTSGENANWGNPGGGGGGGPSTVYVAEPMAIDHRPARPCERQRLEAAGGRVQSKRTEYGGLVGEPRLWLKDIDMPGLLVSRSLGDEIAATVGCTAEPEIIHTTLDFMKHRYLIIASDGVWDVLNNQYVVDLCRGKDAQEACDSIVQASLMEWEDRYQADNISVVVVKFPTKSLDVATAC